MDTKTIFGGTLIVGFLTACWNGIRDTAWRLVSLVIYRARVTPTLVEPLMAYLLENLRQYPFGERNYGCAFQYIRSLKERRYVVFEFLSRTTLIFWKGHWPVFIRWESSGLDGAGSSRPASREEVVCVTCLRGTFDLEAALKVCSDEFRISASGKGSGRFCLVPVRGYQGNTNHNDGSTGGPIGGPAGGGPGASGIGLDYVGKDRRLLHYSREDIGEPAKLGDAAFEALAFPASAQDIRVDAARWLHSRDWYLEKQIPWRRGWCVYGPPGTGKSSLVKALAQSEDMPLIIFDLGSMSNQEFSDHWLRALTGFAPCIILIEDIDAVFHGRENMVNKHSVTFDCFLNTISGVVNSDGVFLVITTNHPEFLDPALGIPQRNGAAETSSSRPGRIDRMLKLAVLDSACRRKIASRILSDYPDEIELAVSMGDGESGAQFQERCAQIALRHYWDSDNARPNGLNAVVEKSLLYVASNGICIT